MKAIGLLAACAMSMAQVAPALACGATAPLYYVVDQQWPKAEPAPRNAPLVVTLKVGQDGHEYPSLEPSLVLTKSGDDQAIALKARGTAPRLVWVPAAPLDANTTYEARYNSGYEGHPDSVWQLTTDDSLHPTLELEGQLQVSFEAGTDRVVRRNCNNCGTDCLGDETIAVTKARVQLPRVVAGFENRTGELWLTDDSPYDFSSDARGVHEVSLPSYVRFDSEGRPSEDVLVTVPEEATPYRPCFALRVTDERGDQATTEPLCVEETFPFSLPGNPSDDPQTAPEVAGSESKTSTSCSFGRAPQSATSLGALAGLFGFGALLRRRFAAQTASKTAHRR